MDKTHDNLTEQLEKVARMAESAILEHKVYLRADAAAKQLNMEEHRDQVLKELEEMLAKKNNQVDYIRCGTI